MRIGILQTGDVPDELVPDFGHYPAMFEDMLAGRGFQFSTYRVVDDHFPDSVGSMDGWLITGSKHGAYDDFPWIARLEQFLREAHSAQIPMAGICFGHQILAKALGGRVEKFSGGWSVGQVRYDGANGDSYRLNAMHQDQVIDPPADSKLLLTSDFCRYAGLVYGDHAITIQPHPEFSNEYTEQLILTRRGVTVPDKTADDALTSFTQTADSAMITDILTNFLRRAHETRLSAKQTPQAIR